MKNGYRLMWPVVVTAVCLVASLGVIRTASAQTEVKLTASDGAIGDLFGSSVSIDGDRVVVGASFDDDTAPQSGSAYIFRRDGTSWSQEAKLTASDAAGGDFFGRSVSIDGDRVVVGALLNDDAGSGSGSAYIFKRTGMSWSQEAKLTASDAMSRDIFGKSVSIDGDRVVVGTRFGDGAGPGSGSAYVFEFAPPKENLVCEVKVDGKHDRVGKSLHLETFNTDPNLSGLWNTLFGVDPPASSGGIVTLQADHVVTWEEGTLEMDGVMKLDVKTDPKNSLVKKVKISKAGKNGPPTTFVSGSGGVNPNLADGGWHEVKIKNMLDVTVSFGGETVKGLLKEFKVKLDKTSTTAAPVVKDFKIDITGVTTAADVKKGTVTSVEVTIPATTITARATTEYKEKVKVDPVVLDGHTEAEFKRAKDAVTEGVDIASLSDGFNDALKECKGSCSITSVSAPKQGVRSVESEPQADIPEGYVLEGNYPNPFNPSATIRFRVPESAQVRLVVYDLLGRQVRVLVDGVRAAGTHEVVFEASDLSSGTYLYRLETPQGSFVKMMLLVK